MSYYFQKCCFEAEVIGKRAECNRLNCDGKHAKFTLFLHKVNNEYFYYLNRKQLEEYWKCVVKDQEVFCPQKCNNCIVCKFLTKAYDELKSAYFFSARKDMPYQPILWKIFTNVIDKTNKIIFRIEIGKTVKAFNLVYNGETC